MTTKTTSFDALVGRKITAIFKDTEGSRLRFVTDAGNRDYCAEGDCCSHSWFNHLAGIECLIGHTVTAVDEHECVDAEGAEKSPDTDVERKYGWTFTTERGRADLDMRNDSNGYYGGEAVLNGESSWRGRVEYDGLIEVVEDF